MLTLIAALLAQPADCSNAMAQQEMNRCAAEAARAADADMNRAAAQVMRAFVADQGGENGEAARRLRDAQRTWLAYRDAQCALAGVEALGGSLESYLVGDCLKTMTEQRTNDLLMLIR